MSNVIKIEDTKAKTLVTSSLGKTLNYQPFSSLYANAIKELEDWSELDESIFLRVLDKTGVTFNKGGKRFPPVEIYAKMKGEDGENRVSFYCKKTSTVSKTKTENFGICVDGLEAYYLRYSEQILGLLEKINTLLVQVRERVAEHEESERASQGRGFYGEISSECNQMFKTRKENTLKRLLK